MSIPQNVQQFRKSLWTAACIAQNTPIDSKFVVFAEDNEVAKAYNNFSVALSKAVETANRTGSSVLVYQSTLRPDEFGVEFTLPNFAERIGDRIYPSNQ